MKSLIFTNPITKETRWCVADVPATLLNALTIEQYIQVVDVGFRDDEQHKASNFKWVDQPEGVCPSTHDFVDGTFVIIPPSTKTTTPSSSATPVVQ